MTKKYEGAELLKNELGRTYWEILNGDNFEGLTVLIEGDTWMDDGLLGINVNLQLEGFDPIIMELPWCGAEGYAAARYANACSEAMEDLADHLIDFIGSCIEAAEEDN